VGANLAETSLNPPPLSGEPRGQGVEEISHPTHGGTYPPTRVARPSPSARRPPTCRISPLLPLLSRRDLLCRATTAKHIHWVRVRAKNRLRHSMFTDHWPEILPANLPIFHRETSPPPLLPRSLSSLGWKRHPSYRIRLNPPTRASFPFPHSPPGSPPHLRLGTLPPDPDSHMSTSPKGGPGRSGGIAQASHPALWGDTGSKPPGAPCRRRAFLRGPRPSRVRRIQEEKK